MTTKKKTQKKRTQLVKHVWTDGHDAFGRIGDILPFLSKRKSVLEDFVGFDKPNAKTVIFWFEREDAWGNRDETRLVFRKLQLR